MEAETFYARSRRESREKLTAALAKPMPPSKEEVGIEEFFTPWGDIIQGIDGSYSSESDEFMIAALEAVRDRNTFEFIEAEGFAAEFMLYVLSGHGLTEYGTSPRGGLTAAARSMAATYRQVGSLP